MFFYHNLKNLNGISHCKLLNLIIFYKIQKKNQINMENDRVKVFIITISIKIII